MAKKNVYAMLTLTAIKGGAVWQESELKYPNQSKKSYTELEDALSRMLVGMGYDVQGLKSKRG